MGFLKSQTLSAAVFSWFCRYKQGCQLTLDISASPIDFKLTIKNPYQDAFIIVYRIWLPKARQ